MGIPDVLRLQLLCNKSVNGAWLSGCRSTIHTITYAHTIPRKLLPYSCAGEVPTMSELANSILDS